MSEARLTKADLTWVKRFVDNYAWVQSAYPELFTKQDIDDFKIVKQIVKEKLDEAT